MLGSLVGVERRLGEEVWTNSVNGLAIGYLSLFYYSERCYSHEVMPSWGAQFCKTLEESNTEMPCSASSFCLNLPLFWKVEQWSGELDTGKLDRGGRRQWRQWSFWLPASEENCHCRLMWTGLLLLPLPLPPSLSPVSKWKGRRGRREGGHQWRGDTTLQVLFSLGLALSRRRSIHSLINSLPEECFHQPLEHVLYAPGGWITYLASPFLSPEQF